MKESVRSAIERNLLSLLQEKGGGLVSSLSLTSTRAIGDAVQSFVMQHFRWCVPATALHEYKDDFGRKSMQDLAFTDYEGNYYAVDVKTHNTESVFNRPNLTSVERLAKLYRKDNNYFCILMVTYHVEGDRIMYTECLFRPIEQLAWSCLTLGALGWGQIQVRDSGQIDIQSKPDRKDWMMKMCLELETFYDCEISKIHHRKDWFVKEKAYWEQSQ